MSIFAKIFTSISEGVLRMGAGLNSVRRMAHPCSKCEIPKAKFFRSDEEALASDWQKICRDSRKVRRDFYRALSTVVEIKDAKNHLPDGQEQQ
ncbi:MAG: hypothetical protein LBL39_04235 [Planctomycetaceae bacterium]|nr:hypothetical protein [Planctomycetaceae bacterium]